MAKSHIFPLLVMGLLVSSGFLSWCFLQPGSDAPLTVDMQTHAIGTRASSIDTWLLDPPLVNNTDHATYWNTTTSKDFESGLMVNTQTNTTGDGSLTLQPSKDFGTFTDAGKEILSMAYSRNSSLLCGLASGEVYLFNPMNETKALLFDTHWLYPGKANVSALAVDIYDRLWGACKDNGNIFLITLSNGTYYPFGKLSTVDSNVTILSANEMHQVWAGTANKGLLHCIDIDTYDTFTFDHFPGNSLSIRTMAYESTSGTLYVGTGAPKDNSAPNPLEPHILAIDTKADMTSAPITDVASYSGLISITAMAVDRSHNIIFSTVPDRKLNMLNVDSGVFFSGNNPTFANITSMYFSELSNSVFCGTDKEGQMFSFSPGPNTFSTLSNGFPGCAAVNILISPSDFFGVWGSQFPNGHLFNMVGTGIWMSPVLNATETAIWDTIHLEYSQEKGGFIFGFLRFGDNVSAVTHDDFNDSTVFFEPTATIKIPDCQYLQIALILQTKNAFDPAVAPILRSVNVTLGYYVEMEIGQVCDHTEAVANSVVNYTVYVNNTSHGIANAKVRLDVPDNAELLSASIPHTFESSSMALFKLYNVTPGQNITFSLSLKITDAIVPGADHLTTQFKLNCTAIRDRYGPEAVSNDLDVPLKEAQASVELGLDKSSASPSEQVTGILTVHVEDGFDIADANVSLTFPQDIEIINASIPWQIIEQTAGLLACWNLGFVPRGGQVNISLLFELDASAIDDSVITLVTRMNYTDGLGVNEYHDDGPMVDLEVRSPLLELVLRTEPSGLTEAQIGQTIPFKLTYSNPGHRGALNVTIIANFTSSAEYTMNPSLSAVTWKMEEISALTPPMVLDLALRVRRDAPNGSALNVSVHVAYQRFPGAAVSTITLPQLSLPIKRPYFMPTVEQTDKENGIRALGTANLKVSWENIGDGECAAVTVKMTLSTPGLHLASDKAKTEDKFVANNVAIGETGDCSFTIAAEKAIAIGQKAVVEFEFAYTDALGNPYSKDVMSFDLELKPRALPPEPFRLKAMSPQDGDIEVPLNARFSARSTFAIDLATLNASVSVTPVVEYDVQLRNGSTEILIKFPQALEYGTTYSIMISSTLKDEYGRNLDRTYYINFTTQPADETTEGVFSSGLCVVVLVLVLIAIVVLAFLFMRQKKIKDRIAELDSAKGSSAEEPEIVYEPDTNIEPVEEVPTVAKARPVARAPKPVEPAVTARPMPAAAATQISLSSEPEPLAKMPQTPSADLPKEVADEADLDIGDPYKTDLDMQKSTEQRGPKPLLFLPPAVIIDMADTTEETPYHLDEVLVMTKEGILVQHFTARGSTEIDEDILAGMLTAVQMFVKDTFGGQKDSTLDELSLGDFKIMIGRGEFITISVILSGENTRLVRPQLDAMIADTEKNLRDILCKWNGDMSLVTPIREYIKNLVEGKYKPKEE